jgi:hypothetical protein
VMTTAVGLDYVCIRERESAWIVILFDLCSLVDSIADMVVLFIPVMPHRYISNTDNRWPISSHIDQLCASLLTEIREDDWVYSYI